MPATLLFSLSSKLNIQRVLGTYNWSTTSYAGRLKPLRVELQVPMGPRDQSEGAFMRSAIQSRNGYKNRILASLSKAEISRLSPNLSALDLPTGKTLLEPGQDGGYAYFIETGLASVVVAMANGNMVETGITGNDGLVGFPALLGTKTAPTRTFMQIAGTGFKIKAQHLLDEIERSGTFRKKSTDISRPIWC